MGREACGSVSPPWRSHATARPRARQQYPEKGEIVALEHIQPPGLFASGQFGFTQVVTSPPGKLVFVSGQVAFDENAQVVGSDLAAQAQQALENLGRALAAAGASPADVEIGRASWRERV